MTIDFLRYRHYHRGRQAQVFIQVRVNGVEDVNGSALPNRYYYFYGSGDTVEDHTSPQITRLTPP